MNSVGFFVRVLGAAYYINLACFLCHYYFGLRRNIPCMNDETGFAEPKDSDCFNSVVW